MLKLIVKGLGGQGAKTFVEILAKAANIEKKFFLAYPEFGPERTGTSINAYFKLDNKRMRDRTPIKVADIIVVLEKKLDRIDSELKKQGTLIINSNEDKKYKFIDANKISKEITNNIIPNIVMLGSLIKVTKILNKESVVKAIEESFSGKIKELNLKCFEEGYKNIE